MDISQLRSASSSKLIAFDQAQVVPGIINDTYFLTVTGEAPCLNMEVALVPMIYIDCPEYWAIEVTGTLKGGICLTAIKPYQVTIPLAGITGSKGVEVVGGNRTEKIDVPGGNCS